MEDQAQPQQQAEALGLNEKLINTYIKKLKEHLDDYHGRAVILEAKNTIQEEQITELQNLAQALMASLEEHKQALASVSDTKDNSAKINGNLSAKLDELTVINVGLKNDYEAAKSDKNNYAHILNQTQETVRSHERKIADLTKELELYKSGAMIVETKVIPSRELIVSQPDYSEITATDGFGNDVVLITPGHASKRKVPRK